MRHRRANRIVVSGAFFAFAWVSLARAEPPADLLADPRVAPVRSEIEAAFARARAKRLPDEWLEDKVTEGLAKRVPPPRIVPAVNALLARMETADRVLEALGPKAAGKPAEREAILRATVDALAVGAPDDALVGLGRAVSNGGGKPSDVHAGFVGVAELGERGFDGSASVDAVLRAFERGGPGAWPWLLSQAEGIGEKGAEARVEALRRAADRIEQAPIPDGVPAAGERLGATGDAARTVGPPSDVSFGRGVGRGAAASRGPPR